jgi:hypothetical protein
MKPNHQADKYFVSQEYVLTDTAFEPSDNCIPTYKNDAAFHLDPDKVKFNTACLLPESLRTHFSFSMSSLFEKSNCPIICFTHEALNPINLGVHHLCSAFHPDILQVGVSCNISSDGNLCMASGGTTIQIIVVVRGEPSDEKELRCLWIVAAIGTIICPVKVGVTMNAS